MKISKFSESQIIKALKEHEQGGYVGDSRKPRVFNVIDDCNREAIAIDVGLCYPTRAVVETLNNLKEEIGTPKYIRCDNGPEFISNTFMGCCKRNFIEIRYTQLGKPM
jgi:putative transposase